jgi:hypothetical protein
MRLKWVPGAWGYNWATLPLGDINTEAWTSRVGVGRGANLTLEKRKLLRSLQKIQPFLMEEDCGEGQGLGWAVEPRRERTIFGEEYRL